VGVWLVNPSKRPVFRLLPVVRAGLYCWVVPTLNRITVSKMRDTLVEQTQVDKKTLSEHLKYLRPRVSGQGHTPHLSQAQLRPISSEHFPCQTRTTTLSFEIGLMVVASEPHRVSTDEDSRKVELLSEEDMDGGEGREGVVLRRNAGARLIATLT